MATRRPGGALSSRPSNDHCRSHVRFVPNWYITRQIGSVFLIFLHRVVVVAGYHAQNDVWHMLYHFVCEPGVIDDGESSEFASAAS